MANEQHMTSKQRLLNAISHLPTDHIPLLLRFWSMGGSSNNIPFPWEEQIPRVENCLALGLDDTLLLEPPFGYVENLRVEQVPGVKSQVSLLPPQPGEEYPRLVKIYNTPDGPLQTTILKTDDWPYGNEIRLFDDYNIPRLKEPLIKNKADLLRLRHLFREPDDFQLEQFRKQAGFLRQQSERLGVVLDGGWSALGDAAMWLCGMERILYGQMDEPEFIEDLLDTIFEWELRRMETVLEQGVDVWVHMAWYEGSDFWSPKNYRKLLKPRLVKLVEKAHANGVKFRYIITKGWKPLRKDFLEMGIDCITGVDPVQDQLDLGEVKREVGDRLCLMGGLNSVVMLSQWSDEQIRKAVSQAIECLAPGGGFILYPVDAIFNDQVWHKVEVLIAQWRDLCERR